MLLLQLFYGGHLWSISFVGFLSQIGQGLRMIGTGINTEKWYKTLGDQLLTRWLLLVENKTNALPDTRMIGKDRNKKRRSEMILLLYPPRP